MGYECIEKTLASYDDLSLIKCVQKWVISEDQLTEHQRKVMYVISKLPPNYRLSSGSGNPSLLARSLNAVDAHLQNGDCLTNQEITEIMADFKELNKNEVKASSHSTVRSSFKTCFQYNNGECSFKDCKFLHLCSRHAQLGKRANHTRKDCSLENFG